MGEVSGGRRGGGASSPAPGSFAGLALGIVASRLSTSAFDQQALGA